MAKLAILHRWISTVITARALSVRHRQQITYGRGTCFRAKIRKTTNLADNCMLQIVVIFGWLIAFCLMAYLATRALKHRLLGRNRRKLALRKIREFRRHHHFDEKRQQWVRKIDGVALIDEAGEDRRLGLALIGWLLFVLWEGYWLLEIAERFSKASHPWQLPYVFLFFILVVVPLAGYLFIRRRMRRSARLPVGRY
ncbi:MAG TPA: hypothetical protein VKE53_05510 [Pseudolabrys sp.]|nr:hypothetical protein [Pseudolabrys sp.]